MQLPLFVGKKQNYSAVRFIKKTIFMTIIQLMEQVQCEMGIFKDVFLTYTRNKGQVLFSLNSFKIVIPIPRGVSIVQTKNYFIDRKISLKSFFHLSNTTIQTLTLYYL